MVLHVCPIPLPRLLQARTAAPEIAFEGFKGLKPGVLLAEAVRLAVDFHNQKPLVHYASFEPVALFHLPGDDDFGASGHTAANVPRRRHSSSMIGYVLIYFGSKSGVLCLENQQCVASRNCQKLAATAHCVQAHIVIANEVNCVQATRTGTSILEPCVILEPCSYEYSYVQGFTVSQRNIAADIALEVPVRYGMCPPAI